MRNAIIAAALLFVLSSAGSAQITLSHSNISVPDGTVLPISAFVDDVFEIKLVNWSKSGGTFTGNTACLNAMVSACTIGFSGTAGNSYTVTATSVFNPAVTASATITITASPTPLTTHPRLYFTSADIPGLVSKAVSSNEAWNILSSMANAGAALDDAGFNAGGGYTCDAGTGVPSASYISSEELGWSGGNESPRRAAIYALMANIDPTTGNRPRWQCRAHDLYMYTMNEILKSSCNLGLCVAININGNYGGDVEKALVVPYDWVYSSFSPSDKTTILAAWHKAGTMIRTNGIPGTAGAIGVTSSSPLPFGTRNDPAIVSDATYLAALGTHALGQLRTSGNNYYSLHILQLGLMGAAIDAADDPDQGYCAGGWTKTCTDGRANSIRAYLLDAVGAYLYKEVLNFEDPYVSTGYLNTSFGSSLSPTAQCSAGYGSAVTDCFGLGRGASSHEGSPLYIGSQQRVVDLFVALQSAGYLDPKNFMGQFAAPQLSFAFSSWWDMSIQQVLHSQVPRLLSGNTQVLMSFGEVNAVKDEIGFLSNQFGSLRFLDQLIGRTDRLNQTAWAYARNLASTSYTFNVNQFPVLNPTHFMWAPTGLNIVSTLTATDPRSSMPKTSFALNSGMFITGSDWGTNGTVLNVQCPIWAAIDHEDNYCGRFQWYWGGDYVTKGVDGYGANTFTFPYERAQYENIMAIRHSRSATLNPYPLNDYNFVQGSPVRWGMNDPTPIPPKWSTSSSYASFLADSTNSRKYTFNSTNATADMLGATRNVFWDKNHHLFLYDRADTTSSDFKLEWFITTGTPTITGREITWTSSLGTVDAGIDVLLPTTAVAYSKTIDFAKVSADYSPSNRVVIDGNASQSVVDELATPTFNSWNTVVYPAKGVLSNVAVKYASNNTALTEVPLGTTLTAGTYVVVDNIYFFYSTDTAQMKLSYTGASQSTSQRFLLHFEAQTHGVTRTKATLVQSTSGTSFDCGKSDAMMVCFKRNLSDTFSGTIVPASGATQIFLNNLTPGSSYSLSGATPSSCTADSAGVCGFAAPGTGDVTVGDAGPPPVSPPAPAPFFADVITDRGSQPRLGLR